MELLYSVVQTESLNTSQVNLLDFKGYQRK